MSYKALYRKWRPADFDEVRGQDAVVTTLRNQVISDRIGHAYLFCGTRGTGKTSVAKIFARAVNCPDAAANNGNPCNKCEVCREILNGSSINVFEIDAASNNGVDNIREIREQVEYPPTSGRYKIYIIDEVHMLSTGAFNALLKTLEEPPAYVIFILATTDPQKIPQTILSRCQRYDFRRMSLDTLTDQLREICTLEHIDIDGRALEAIGRSAEGSMRDALSILDQCRAFARGRQLGYDMVLDILGTEDSSVFAALYAAVVEARPEAALEIIDRIIREGRDESRIVKDFVWHLRNVLLAGNAAGGAVLEVSDEELRALCSEYKLAPRARLLEILSAMAELSNRSRFASRKRVLLEMEIIRLCLNAGGASGASSVPDAVSVRQMTSPKAQVVMIGDPKKDQPADKKPQLPPGVRPDNTGAVPGETIPVSPRITVPEGISDAGAPDVMKSAAADSSDAAVTADNPLQNDQDDLTFLRENWKKLADGLDASNKAVYADVIIRMEQNKIRLIFRNMISYRIASMNRVENGLKKIEELCRNNYGRRITLTARVANPGELDEIERPDISDLDKINFPVNIID